MQHRQTNVTGRSGNESNASVGPEPRTPEGPAFLSEPGLAGQLSMKYVILSFVYL